MRIVQWLSVQVEQWNNVNYGGLRMNSIAAKNWKNNKAAW